MRRPIPDRDAPLVDAQGRVTPAWLEYIRDLEGRAFREKVSTTSPTNGQTMKYVSATGLWTPST